MMRCGLIRFVAAAGAFGVHWVAFRFGIVPDYIEIIGSIEVYLSK